MNILCSGGAGYVGSHAVRTLAARGHRTVVLDNLVYGHREAVPDVPLHVGDIEDMPLVARLLREERIDLVMHFAAYAYVGESVGNPRKYYNNNLVNAVRLLDAMLDAGVDKIVFSSTCATFGNPRSRYIDEQHEQSPVNPYGMSKYMLERIIRDYHDAHGLKYVFLRYFNAAGADPSGEIGEDHDPETHLIPLVLQTALGKYDKVRVFGDDYDTHDGTCIRDYIHVNDIADAHVRAADHIASGNGSDAFNLGTGKGSTVKEVLRAAQEVCGFAIPSSTEARRVGDPPCLVASSGKAKHVLGWEPKFSAIEDIISTAWKWHSTHPGGFASIRERRMS